MPQIPRQLWSQDQTEQLFRQIKLAHGSNNVEEDGEGDVAMDADGLQKQMERDMGMGHKVEKVRDDKVDLAGLRVFG